MYVAVKGGERAIENAHRLLAHERRGDRDVPELSLGADLRAAQPRRRSRHDRGLALRPRVGGAGDEAGARRHDRGDLPGSRFPRHAAALRRQRAGRHRPRCRCAAGFPRPSRTSRAARFSGRPSITPIACWIRSSPRHRRREAPATAEATPAATPRVDRHPRPRRPDRAFAQGRRRYAGRRPHARTAELSRRSRSAAAKSGARPTKVFCWRSAIPRSAATAATIPSPAKFASARSRSSSWPRMLGFAVPLGAIDADRMPDGQPVQGLGHRGAVLHARLWPRVRAERAQDHVDGAGRPRAARPRTRRGGHRAGAGRGVRDVAFRQCAGDRLRRASQAAALCRLPVRARPAAQAARGVRRGGSDSRRMQEAAE